MEDRKRTKEELEQPASHRKHPRMKEDTGTWRTFLGRGCMLSQKQDSRNSSPLIVVEYSQNTGKKLKRLLNTRRIKEHTARLPNTAKRIAEEN